MPIDVLCTGCRTRFRVSEKYAGRTGPCPKCKKPITIPTADQGVKIHEPEPAAASSATGQMPTKPIPKRDRPIPLIALVLCGAATLVAVVLALLARLLWGPGATPTPVLAGAALVTAITTSLVGYAMVRNRDLEPFRGRELLLRTVSCGIIYAGLWWVRTVLPAESTLEIWQWLYIGPLFFAAGGVAALASFELEWSPAVLHFSLYLLCTAILRWLAGFTPV